MEIITKRSIIARFLAQYDINPAADVVNSLMHLNSDAQVDAEKYGWLGGVPQFSEENADFQADRLAEYEWIIKNRKFSNAIKFSGSDWRQDKTNQIMPKIDQFAYNAMILWWQLMAEAVLAAESKACYDGQFFYDTDHPTNGATQSNDIGVTVSGVPVATKGTAAAPSAGTLSYAVHKGIEQILGLKDDRGNFCNEMAMAFLAMVPLHYSQAAGIANTAQVFGTGDPNTLKTGMYNVSVKPNPRITGNKVHIFRIDTTAKPFIGQEEEGVMPYVLDHTSEHYKKKDEVVFGARAIRNLGFGEYLSACLVTLS